jgi:hypothetical protein
MESLAIALKVFLLIGPLGCCGIMKILASFGFFINATIINASIQSICFSEQIVKISLTHPESAGISIVGKPIVRMDMNTPTITLTLKTELM